MKIENIKRKIIKSSLARFEVFFDEVWDFFETILSLIPTKIGIYIREFIIGLVSKGNGFPVVRRNCHIFRPWRLKVGKNVSIGRFCSINCVGAITLSDKVRIGPGVMITTLKHNYTMPNI